MKVNLAVCGRFHYHNYVRHLAKLETLNRFYYSHKFGTDSAALGIRKEQAVNIWTKEYLLGIHSRLAGGRLGPQMAALCADLWQACVLRRWEECDILHLMLHGTGVALARRAQREGSVVIVEPVNQHTDAAVAIVEEERETLGLKPTSGPRRVEQRQIEETKISDFLLAPSRIVRDSFVKRGYDVRRTAVLPYGVDTDRFRPLDDRDQARYDRVFRALCVAQISVRKGHVYLLEAWKRLALPNSELLLIGALSNEMGPIIDRYRGLFRHISGVPNARLRDYYGCATVLVLPSLEDGCAVVCAEAMACGVPVITTSSNGASEVIDHGRDGFVVPVRSPEAIAECLERLYQDEQLRQEMSAAALTKAIGKLSWETYASNLDGIYRVAIDRQ
jgi:glycosyltransferase involved in cell wall biosynthesis